MSRSLRKKVASHPSNRTASNCGFGRCAGFIVVAYISAALLLLSPTLLPNVGTSTSMWSLTAALPTPADVYHQACLAWTCAANEALRFIYPSNDDNESHEQLVVHNPESASPQSGSSLATVEIVPAPLAKAPDPAASDAASAIMHPSGAFIASVDVGDMVTAAGEAAVQSELRNDDRAWTFSGTPAILVEIETATMETTAMRSNDVPTAYISFEKWGRLGNRMFQYASGLALALRYGRPAVLVLPDAFAEKSMDAMRSIFRLSELPTLFERPLLPAAGDLLESGWGRYDAVRFDNASTFERSFYTVGYFQSWKYFEPMADRMRQEFALTADVEQAADLYFRSVGLPLQSDYSDHGDDGQAKHVRVGVHVRRGDMLNKAAEYTVAPAEYLLKAIAYYCHKYAAPRYNVSFVFATDDRSWVLDFVASLLPHDVAVHFVNLDISGDMAVLSRCDHSIVTSGTFGWWAAWLAGGDVVYYSDFIRPESPLYSGHDPEDYYPPNWLGLTA